MIEHSVGVPSPLLIKLDASFRFWIANESDETTMQSPFLADAVTKVL